MNNINESNHIHPSQSNLLIQSNSIDRLSNRSLASSSMTKKSYQPKLPPIHQNLISTYRHQKLKVDLLSYKMTSSNFIMDFFCGVQNTTTVSMCTKCARSQHANFCSFILQIVQQNFDWKNDPKFKSSYEFYNKKESIPIFLTDQEIEYRLQSKFNILGVVLLQNDKLLLVRILRNYIKHTIYYGQEYKFSLQNDFYFWFLVGIYFHIGLPRYFYDFESLPRESIGLHQPMMFWVLDSVMKKLGQFNRQTINKMVENMIQYSSYFYLKQFRSLTRYYGIDLRQIFHEWINEGMMGYIGIQFIGFFIKSIMQNGSEYIPKMMLSYFETVTSKMGTSELVNFQLQQHPILQSQNIQQIHRKKQQLLRMLLNSNEVWANIFYSTTFYNLKG